MRGSLGQRNKGWLVTIFGTYALLTLGVLYAWIVVKANTPIHLSKNLSKSGVLS